MKSTTPFSELRSCSVKQLSLLAFVSTFYLASLEVSETNGGLNLTHILAIFFL
jgi:hypothetical protein